jgi:small subunit ribosomal protein S16
MAVHIRLARGGTKKKPFYRVVVTDHRAPRGGKFLENIGTFDPTARTAKEGEAPNGEMLSINHERLAFWTARGATPSETLAHVLKRAAKLNPPPVVEAAAPAKAAKAPKAAKPSKAAKK